MVEKNKASSLEKKFKIKIPYSEVEKKIEENYIELSKTLKIAGFRPGKVPLSFVKSKYEKEVKSKVTEKIIQEEGNKGFESNGFRLAAQPKVKLISNIDDKSDTSGWSRHLPRHCRGLVAMLPPAARPAASVPNGCGSGLEPSAD